MDCNNSLKSSQVIADIEPGHPIDPTMGREVNVLHCSQMQESQADDAIMASKELLLEKQAILRDDTPMRYKVSNLAAPS